MNVRSRVSDSDSAVDPWEALHEDYLETAKVLDHFEHEINTVRGPFDTPQGPKKAKIALLAGADLIQTMSAPGVWAPKDIDYILSNFGAFIIEVRHYHMLLVMTKF